LWWYVVVAGEKSGWGRAERKLVVVMGKNKVKYKKKIKKKFFREAIGWLGRNSMCLKCLAEGREGKLKVLRFFYGEQGKFGEKIEGLLLANGKKK
jgi:hypothetical protein